MRNHPEIKLGKLTEEEKSCYNAWSSFSTKYIIQDYVPDAVWDFEITLPEPPKDPREIINWGKPKKDRKFPYYSDEYIRERLESEDAKNFIDQEWDRRYNGLFWFNGDKLEYIVGHHYMFLQYWKIPVVKNGRNTRSQPFFREFHRDLGYFTEYTKKDPKARGNVFFSLRRSGKTAYYLCDAFLDTTENKESVCYIQSKTEGDAKSMMRKLVDSWKRLPSFLKPRDTGRSRVERKLDFSDPLKISTKKEEKEYKETLNSFIEAVNSKEAALDGNYASYIIDDEIGKTEGNLDVNERWNINRECLTVGDRIVGYSIQMSTVEDMDKYGSDKALDIWNRSDSRQRLANGQTNSGLYRIFFPAYYSYDGTNPKTGEDFIDEWGYCDIEAAKEYIEAMYESMEGEDLLSYRRKYPLTIKDCFVTKDSGNSYNKRNLYMQRQYNESLSNTPVVRGNFVWKDGQRFGDVEFYPDESGRWLRAWIPPEEDRNGYMMKGVHKYPTRDYCRTGVDPFDHKVVKSGKGSDGAAATILKHHHKYPELKRAWVCIYQNRPNSANEFYEDILKQCIFYSSPILVESNKSGFLNWLEEVGYDGYAMEDPLETDPKKMGGKGIPTTGERVRRALMDKTQHHIYSEIGWDVQSGWAGYCPFNELIKDWEDFEPDRWTPYDLAVAAGIALIACEERKGIQVAQGFRPDQFFKQYKVVGDRSVPLNRNVIGKASRGNWSDGIDRFTQ